jgi:hypothetical protein
MVHLATHRVWRRTRSGKARRPSHNPRLTRSFLNKSLRYSSKHKNFFELPPPGATSVPPRERSVRTFMSARAVFGRPEAPSRAYPSPALVEDDALGCRERRRHGCRCRSLLCAVVGGGVRARRLRLGGRDTPDRPLRPRRGCHLPRCTTSARTDNLFFARFQTRHACRPPAPQVASMGEATVRRSIRAAVGKSDQ